MTDIIKESLMSKSPPMNNGCSFADCANALCAGGPDGTQMNFSMK
jgi:hypothetical protein